MTLAERGFRSPSRRRRAPEMWGGVRGGRTPDLRTLSLPHIVGARLRRDEGGKPAARTFPHTPNVKGGA
jgi:hypothetical protein